MNKKLISLAVAAALVAPAAAMADAVLYGKINVSLDYADVQNQILPVYNMTNVNQTWGNVLNPATGNLVPAQVPAGTPGSWVVAPGGTAVNSQNFTGWGMGTGYIPQNAPVTGAGGGRASRLGVKGSEELGGGLKAIYQIELGINPTDTNNNLVNNADAITMRNTFVGLAGGWGTALMGRHDTPLKISTGKLDLFADTLADYNATVGFQDLRADNAVAYISPSLSGFTFAAAVVPAGGGTALGVPNTESDNINEGWSVAGIYSNGPFYGSVAYESLGYELFNTNTNNAGCAANVAACTTSNNDWNKWRFGLGLLDWNGFTLDAIYESQSGIAGSDVFTQGTIGTVNWVLPGNPNKANLWQIQAGYSFGASQIKAMYGQAEFDSDSFVAVPGASALQQQQWNDIYTGNRSTWAVGYDYNFSKRTKAYVLYTDVADDRADWIAGSEWSGFSLGMMHSF
jgi:predicted porin